MTRHRSERIQDHGKEGEIGKQKGSGMRKSSGLRGGLSKIMVVLGSLLLPLLLYGQTSGPAVPRSETEINNSARLQLPVVHAHFGSWCMGFLTIAPEGIRYHAVQSQGKHEDSFSLKREQVLFLNYWALAGQPMNAVEIKTATKNYHFWLMKSAEQLQFTHSNWRPVEAAPSDILLLSLYYWRVTGNVPNLTAVKAALVQARVQATVAAVAQARPSDSGTVNGDPYEKMSQHIYANTSSYSSTVNQINSINHMSHW